MVTAIGGLPFGRGRLYGQVGGAYTQALTSTTQVNAEWSRTDSDGVTTTFAGGTQTWETKTTGWGLVWGGGVEAWVTPKKAAWFIEFQRLKITGTPLDGSEFRLSDHEWLISTGIRLKLGK
jgi:hypothetical protein